MTQKPVNRYVKVLQITEDPVLLKEYIDWHKPGKVWPEITEGLRAVGVLDMEIYLDDNKLIMIMDLDPAVDHNESMEKLGTLPRQAEWEAMMDRYHVTRPGANAKEKWKLIEKVFTLPD
ncbi:MAG: L-rhamnose mutarotase [Cyclobacteriaceae bacterium]|nr:L-rhamnose mutarotase [Cyclobacteriaceae bacterium]